MLLPYMFVGVRVYPQIVDRNLFIYYVYGFNFLLGKKGKKREKTFLAFLLFNLHQFKSY